MGLTRIVRVAVTSRAAVERRRPRRRYISRGYELCGTDRRRAAVRWGGAAQAEREKENENENEHGDETGRVDDTNVPPNRRPVSNWSNHQSSIKQSTPVGQRKGRDANPKYTSTHHLSPPRS